MTKTPAAVTVTEADRDWLDEDTWASIPRYMHRHIMACAARHRLSALAGVSQDKVAEAGDYERAYFERGFIAAYAWAATKLPSSQLSDAVIDRAWDHRDEGMNEHDMLPVLALAQPATSVVARIALAKSTVPESKK